MKKLDINKYPLSRKQQEEYVILLVESSYAHFRLVEKKEIANITYRAEGLFNAFAFELAENGEIKDCWLLSSMTNDEKEQIDQKNKDTLTELSYKRYQSDNYYPNPNER